MTASIIVLPLVREDRGDGSQTIRLTLSRRDYGRLVRRASEWGISECDAAAAVLSRALDPKGR